MAKLSKIFGSTSSVLARSLSDYVELRIGRGQEFIEDKGVRYVRVIDIVELGDIQPVTESLYRGDIVILNTRAIIERNREELRRMIEELKEITSASGGDIAGIAEDKIIVTPPSIKIART